MSSPPPTPPTPPNPPTPPAALARIVERTRADLSERKARTPLRELEAMVAQEEPPRNFFRAVTKSPQPAGVAVIAEVKRRSPSAGLIRPEYDGDGFRPEEIASGYERAGAAAVSCLTDGPFFGGDLSFIQRIKDRVSLPVLRKDFIVDPYQLWESRAHGADAVLLIAECLTEGEIVDMLILAQQLQLTTLLEVHSMENLLRVRPHVGFPHRSYNLLGINNRDLDTMKVDIGHALRLAELVEDRSVLVAESGIQTGSDLRRLRAEGVRIALIGEHLMRSPDPGAALGAMLREAGTIEGLGGPGNDDAPGGMLPEVKGG